MHYGAGMREENLEGKKGGGGAAVRWCWFRPLAIQSEAERAPRARCSREKKRGRKGEQRGKGGNLETIGVSRSPIHSRSLYQKSLRTHFHLGI